MAKTFISRIFLNDKFILLLVLLNIISVFVGGYYPGEPAFTIADATFTLLFVIEVLIKIREYGWKEYWADGWNKFDFIITAAALPSLINLVFDVSIATNVLLAFRVLRVFKASFVVTIGVCVLLLVLSILTSALFGSFAPDLIATRSSESMAIFARIYFTIELFIGGILGMSLINSIFVDAAVCDNNEEVLQKLNSIESYLKDLSKNEKS